MCQHSEHSLLQTDYHTLLCTSCGEEQQNFGNIRQINQSYSQSVYPFSQCYSREKRFREMLENVFYPCFSTLDNTLCEHVAVLHLTSVEGLFKAVKKLKLKDKRYGSMHVFAKQFVAGYVSPAPVSRHLVNIMCLVFSEIELVYIQLFGVAQFFNYSWLILKFLKVLGLNDYVCYVKALKCEKRARLYEAKFSEVMRELVRLNTGLILVDALAGSQSRLVP